MNWKMFSFLCYPFNVWFSGLKKSHNRASVCVCQSIVKPLFWTGCLCRLHFNLGCCCGWWWWWWFMMRRRWALQRSKWRKGEAFSVNSWRLKGCSAEGKRRRSYWDGSWECHSCRGREEWCQFEGGTELRSLCESRERSSKKDFWCFWTRLFCPFR